MNYKIFQICFQQDQLSKVDPLFTPFDNTENKHPELREYHCFKSVIDEGFSDNLDAWGFMGPHQEKDFTYSALDIKNTLDKNPTYDIYIFNSCQIAAALTKNVWEKEDGFTKKIKEIITAIFKAEGHDISVLEKLMPDYTFNSSLFIAKKKFWADYMLFLKNIVKKLETLNKAEDIFYISSIREDKNQKMEVLPSILERLLPTFLCLKKYKVYSAPYNFNIYKGHIKDHHIAALNSIYWIKTLALSQESVETLEHWENFRKFFIINQPKLDRSREI